MNVGIHKKLRIIDLNEEKNYVPQGGIEPTASLFRFGLAVFKCKMSSMLPTELQTCKKLNFNVNFTK